MKDILGAAWTKMMQTLTPPPLPDLVGAIYDCIPDSALWQDTLERIRHVWEGELATLGVIDSANGALRLSVTCGKADMLEGLLRYGSEDVPFYSAVPKMELDVPQTVDTIYAMQGPDAREKWLSSRAATEWAIPNRIDDFLWVPVMRQASRVGSLVVMTSKDRPQISAADIQALALIAPHVRRAVTIGDLFESERRKGEIFRDVVDCLAHPVLIVSADMQIIFANLAAEALLQEKMAIRSLRGQLSFPYLPANKAVSAAVATGHQNEFALGPAGINVPLALAEKPMVAHVMPLAQRDPSARVAQHAAAAIFIAAPGETAAAGDGRDRCFVRLDGGGKTRRRANSAWQDAAGDRAGGRRVGRHGQVAAGFDLRQDRHARPARAGAFDARSDAAGPAALSGLKLAPFFCFFTQTSDAQTFCNAHRLLQWALPGTGQHLEN